MPLDVDRFTSVVASTVKTLVAGLTERVARLEARTPERGERGEVGPQGEKGERGERGEVGPVGPQGEAGLAGALGPQGSEGPVGPAGPQGEKGLDGTPGRDGRDGLAGVQGEKGLDGKDGRDGANGKDGAPGRDGTLEQLKCSYDGERTVTFMFKDGTPIEGGTIRMPIVLDRGVFKEGQTYEAGDGATWGGSFYIAQRSTSAKPGQPSDDSRAWRLAVKKGADGKSGPQGPEGPQGKAGPQGPLGPRGYGA